MHKQTKAYLLLSVLLLIIPIVYSAEDFSAFSAHSTLATCTLSNDADVVTIINTGDSYSDYTVQALGPGMSYVTVVPNFLSLMPGETTTATLYYHFPKEAVGDYPTSIHIRTQSGIEKEIRQVVTTRTCNNNLLLAYNFNQTSCPCVPLIYNFTVKNTGSYIETYDFGLDRFAEYGNVNVNPILLGPGESANILLNIRLNCSIYGSYLTNFYSYARTSGVRTKVPLLLNINRCYDYALNTGRIVENTNAKYNTSFSRHDGGYEVCAGDNRSIQVQLDNTGYITNEFYYSIAGPEWGSIYGNFMKLAGKDKGYTFVDLSPPKEVIGNFKFIVNSDTEIGNERKQKLIDLNVTGCYGVLVDVPLQEKVCNCEESSVRFKVENTGKFKETVILSTEGMENVNLSASRISLDPFSSQDIILNLAPECGTKGKSSVKVVASLESKKASAEDSMSLDILPIEDCYNLKIDADTSRVIGSEKTIIPVSVRHIGSKEAIYRIEINGSDWITSDARVLSLKPVERTSFNLIADPKNVTQGNYYAAVRIGTGNVVYEKKIHLKVIDGKGVFSAIGSFFYYYRYWIVSLLILILIAIVLVFYFKERTRVWRIKRLIRKSLKSEEEKKAKSKNQSRLERRKEERKKKRNLIPVYIAAIGIVVIALILGLMFFKGAFTAIFNVVWAFIVQYLFYIILGFLILVIIIFILNRSEKK